MVRTQTMLHDENYKRARLCRQAAARFDADTAARLADLLAPVAEPERLAEVGDWLVRSDTAAEFHRPSRSRRTRLIACRSTVLPVP